MDAKISQDYDFMQSSVLGFDNCRAESNPWLDLATWVSGLVVAARKAASVKVKGWDLQLTRESPANRSPSPESSTLQRLDLDDLVAVERGDPDAFGQIVQRHQQAVAEYLWRFTQSKATLEELVQTTFVEAYTSRRTYRGHGPFAHWLRVIATRVGYRFWTESSRHRMQTLPRDHIAAASERSSRDATSELMELMELLPPADRLVLMLHHIEGYSMDEIAQMCGWSRGAAKTRAYRAKESLRQLWNHRR